MDGKVAATERVLQEDGRILVNCTTGREALGPLLKNTPVDLCLKHREREGETELELLAGLGHDAMLGQEAIDTVGNEVTEVAHLARLEFIGHLELLLLHAVLTLALELELTHTQVRAAEIEGKVPALFLTRRATRYETGNHGN